MSWLCQLGTVMAAMHIVAAVAQCMYPTELISTIRFYHLQESFYDEKNEQSLWQAERYLAQDLLESIEEASFVIGLTTNMCFLPPTHFTVFEVMQRMAARYGRIDPVHLKHVVLQRAFDVYQRQKVATTSALVINELASSWLSWWDDIIAVAYGIKLPPPQPA